MNHHIEDPMMMLIQLYPDAYTQIVPQPADTKPRRRRRKNKGVDNGGVGAKKRKLSDEQVNLLELNFGTEHKLESERKDKLASELGLDPRQVAVWFQNRRARWKNKKLEEEYCNLKKVHETTIVEKCRLETEVLKLKEQLSEAEKEIQQLMQRINRVSINSPSSSQSMEAVDPPFLGAYTVEGYDDAAFYMPETQYINSMDWVNLYM